MKKILGSFIINWEELKMWKCGNSPMLNFVGGAYNSQYPFTDVFKITTKTIAYSL